MTSQDKNADKAAEIEAAKQAVENIFSADPTLCYVETANRYAILNPVTKVWRLITVDALKNRYPELKVPLIWDCYGKIQKEQGRVMSSTTYCASKEGPEDPSALNLVVQNDWIQPEDLTSRRTINTKWFDYLIESLGNNDPEQMEHLMQCVGWKWLHPEDFMLPCACFYGQAGAGKQVLMMLVMGTIFNRTCVDEIETSPGFRFNDKMAGKLVYTFNEQMTDRTNSESLKHLVGNRTLDIEAKFMPKMTVPNMAWYCVTTNDPNGAVKIEDNNSNRRYSLLKLESTLLEVVQRHNSWSFDEAKAALGIACNTIYVDKAEVAVFLSDCVDACKGLTCAPTALHGKNLEELRANIYQAAPKVCEEVFIDHPRFTFITTKTLYKLYRAKTEEFGQSHPKAMTSFIGDVHQFIKERKLPISFKRQACINLTRRDVFFKGDEFKSAKEDNEASYMLGRHLESTPKELSDKMNNVINLNTHKGEQE